MIKIVFYLICFDYNFWDFVNIFYLKKEIFTLLNISYYESINKFQAAIHRTHFVDSAPIAFREVVCRELENIFGYHQVIFGYSNMQKEKEYGLNIITHNLKNRFVENFYSCGILSEREMLTSGNFIIFSQTDSYNKKRICRAIMSEYGFSDFFISFLEIDGMYTGYLIVFNEKKKGSFSKIDKEIFDIISPFIAVEYSNCLNILQLRNVTGMLKEQFNYYPFGVIIMSDVTTMTYANETAKEYMSELGISSLKYFSIFYNNHLIPNVKNAFLSNNQKNIVHYKNFIFNIVFSISRDKLFFDDITHSNPPKMSVNKIAENQSAGGYIYIFKDKYSVFSKSVDYFEEYSFTPKEQLVAEQLIMGKDAGTIASELDISINTVKVHIRNLYSKANVRSRAEFIFKMNNMQ